MGLNESFSSANGQILMMNPLPSIAQAFSLIKQKERQRQDSTVLTSFIANAKHEQISGKSYGNGNLHNDDNGNGTGYTGKKSNLKCNYCHKEGHTKENCFKLVGYPPKGRGRGKFSGNSSVPGAKVFPRAMQVSDVPGNNSKDSRDSSAVPTGSQSQLDQLQQQVAQMANFMNMMMGNNSNNKPCSTPEDHIANRMTGLAYSMMSYSILHQKSCGS